MDRKKKGKGFYDSVCKYKSRYFYVVTVLPMGENHCEPLNVHFKYKFIHDLLAIIEVYMARFGFPLHFFW